jgi:hypothetical protein
VAKGTPRRAADRLALMAIATATATFTGVEDSVAVVWSTAFVGAPTIKQSGVNIADGNGPVSVDLISVTNTGCTVETSGRFTGTVDLIASGT